VGVGSVMGAVGPVSMGAEQSSVVSVGRVGEKTISRSLSMLPVEIRSLRLSLVTARSKAWVVGLSSRRVSRAVWAR